jgi:CII-binding regulator of phage lambda lysogenization HflD
MEKLELITKKVDKLLNNHAVLVTEKSGLIEDLENANNQIADLTDKLAKLQETYDMKDLEMDDILSKLGAIVVDNSN